MKRPIFCLTLVVLLLSCSLVLGQVDSSPPPAPPAAQAAPPSGPPWPPPSPPPPPQPYVPPGQPVYPPGQPAIPPGQPATPPAAPYVAPPGQPVYPPGQPVYPPPGQLVYPPPGQPVYQPTPWIMAPSVPMWQPPPSPALGLIPGAGSPHWDVNIEALWLERDASTPIFLGQTNYNGSGIPTHNLWSDDVCFPLAPGVRVQLTGRITDEMAVEAIGWGLQQWSVGRTIYGDPVGETVLAQSPWLRTAPLIPGYDNWLGYTYNSQVANAEINQRFKFLSFDPYRALSWLWGVRYFYLSDDFTLGASDLYSGINENLNWQTKNNLIGAQLGLQWAWGWDRFQLSTEAKVGLYANAYSQQETDTISGTAAVPSLQDSHSGTDLAVLFELSLMARYRITDCLWLRGGYQYYCASGLATGPRQLGGFDDRGTVQLDGLSIGMEWVR